KHSVGVTAGNKGWNYTPSYDQYGQKVHTGSGGKTGGEGRHGHSPNGGAAVPHPMACWAVAHDRGLRRLRSRRRRGAAPPATLTTAGSLTSRRAEMWDRSSRLRSFRTRRSSDGRAIRGSE